MMPNACGTGGNSMDKMSAYRKDGQPRSRNRFPTECGICGTPLQPSDGIIERKKDGTWWAACADRLPR